jgi:hypothetical protein
MCFWERPRGRRAGSEDVDGEGGVVTTKDGVVGREIGGKAVEMTAFAGLKS